MRITSLILVLSVVAVAGYAGYSRFYAPKPAATAQKPQGPVPVEAVKATASELIVSLSTVGTLKANESLMLKPEITGRIEAINAAEGAAVRKGDLLVSIDDRVYAAELKQAEAALNLARTNYSRARLLKEKGAGTVSNYDTMGANLSVAQAQVDLTRAALDKTRILAPFDGVMGLRHVSPGDYVNPGQDIATFQSKNPMKAEFTLPENASNVVKTSQQIAIHVDAIPDRTFTGSVYAIDPQINEASRNITLRALIPNDDGSLLPGMFARVSIITAHKDRALMLPESAIIPRGNESFVMRIGEGNKAASAAVTIGERRNGMVEILTGIAEGDIIVTAGHAKLREGSEASYTLAATSTPPVEPAAGK